MSRALPRDIEAIHDEILALEEAIKVTAAGIVDVDVKARSQSWATWGAPSAGALSSAAADEHLTPRSCLLLYFCERLARLNERVPDEEGVAWLASFTQGDLDAAAEHFIRDIEADQ